MLRLRLFIAFGLALLSLQLGVQADPSTAPAAPKFRIGKIEAPNLAECSGIVASRKHAGVFWAINDSGNAPSLFALTREGKAIAEYPVTAKNIDWEDLAIDDDGHLYIAETGNNQHQRKAAAVYRIAEPDPAQFPKDGVVPPLRVERNWKLQFPEPFDCESLTIYRGKGYLIPKQLEGKEVAIYAFDLNAKEAPATAELSVVAMIPIRTPITATEISADGKWLAVLSVTGPSLFKIDGDVANAGKVKPLSILYFSPKMESCCFIPEGLLATTEERDMFLFRWKNFGIE